MEMEKRKKKRVTRVEEEGERVDKKRLKGQEEYEGGGDAVPTEEEVEEVFDILRRMGVTLKYVTGKGRGVREWRDVLETADLAVDRCVEADGEQEGDDANPKQKRGEVANVIEDFDLNAAASEAAGCGGA